MIFKMASLLILLCVSLSLSKEVKALNNPPVQTIRLVGGDVVDCVDFYKQPAFDHPLLKDHKIQMPPQSYVTRRIKELESARFSDQACAIGTVPIRRTTKEELAMAGALNHKAISASDANSPHMIYVYMQKLEQRRYHGASAVISVHSLNITDRHQYSTASVWIENGPYDALNMISVGWMVKSDSVPRLYLYWTADGGHKTGCYNLFCQGFVQVDPKISLGQILEPVSSYGGPIYDVKIKVFQDRETKNWILYYSEKDIIVGYLPKELFPLLQYGAQLIAWGGVAYKANDEISPPMGSGYKPDGQYNHAAYFKNLTYYAYNFIRRWPSYYNTGHRYEASDCYGLQNVSDSEQTWRTRFLYGGPGGHCGN